MNFPTKCSTTEKYYTLIAYKWKWYNYRNKNRYLAVLLLTYGQASKPQ